VGTKSGAVGLGNVWPRFVEAPVLEARGFANKGEVCGERVVPVVNSGCLTRSIQGVAKK